LQHLSFFLETTPQGQNPLQVTENIWSVFFPEGRPAVSWKSNGKRIGNGYHRHPTNIKSLRVHPGTKQRT
jgi:hypothetical protein